MWPQWSTDPANTLIVGYGLLPELAGDGDGGGYVTYEQNLSYPRRLVLSVWTRMATDRGERLVLCLANCRNNHSRGLSQMKPEGCSLRTLMSASRMHSSFLE